MFANSINGWEILQNNVEKWTLKSLCRTRWESRVESVKAIKFQLLNVREALEEVQRKEGDAAISQQAGSLAEIGRFDFLVSIVLWYEVLNKVNIVSKNLQSKDMHLETAIKEISTLISYFKEFRETGFSKVIDEVKELAIEMDIDPIFHQKKKRVVKKKKYFDDESSSSQNQESSFTLEENFRVNYFLFLIDHAITSLETRFEQFQTYEKLFGFLFPHKLKIIEDEELKASCEFLEKSLSFNGRSDICANELYIELKLFETSRTTEFSNPIDVLNHLRGFTHYPTACVAYRILLTIPVTVASAERSFSKLKLVKSYLRTIMSQDRLNGLAIMAIESEVLDSINCEELIKEFAGKNARRSSRIIC